MLILYSILFIVLILLSAFFSSSETSILSLDRIRLKHKAKKKNKKAVILYNIIKKPQSFFSMILFGNNLVNIAAASISSLLTAKILNLGDELTVVVSTIITTIIVLFFAEIIPKTYAFGFSEKIAFAYAYPIKILSIALFPFVFIITKISKIFVPKTSEKSNKKLTIDELKYFLKTEIELFKYNPEVMKMINEIIDLSGKDLKGVMTPRNKIIAIKESSYIEELKTILLEKKVSKIPVYNENLDNIIGVINLKNIVAKLVEKSFEDLSISEIMDEPIYVSEYSSSNYVLDEFRNKKKDMAIILDEYGVTIGLLTINDIFKEVLGEIELGNNYIKKISDNVYIIDGICSVEELNGELELDLNEGKDYTTLSGLFIFYFGKLPRQRDSIKIDKCSISVELMGDNRIEKLKLVIDEEGKEESK